MMCTVSIVSSPDRGAIRVLMNRDERRLRPVARPPAVHATRTGFAIWPIDAEAGGTWIAANDAGLVLLVLNADGARRSPRQVSRGQLIPALAGAGSIEELLGLWDALDVSGFAPFRLVVVAREQVAVCASTGSSPVLTRIGRARVCASSALGDAEAESARGALFARMLRTEIDPWVAQTRFHRHAWPDRRHLSVMMSRVDACTVSQTEVTLTPSAVSLVYRPIVDGWPVTTTERALPLKRASRAA